MSAEIPQEIKDLMTEGLKHGFGGGNSERAIRSGIPVDKAELELFGCKYVDVWHTSPSGFSSGQEIAKLGEEEFSRAYGDSVLRDEESLKRLGITKKDVLGRLRGFILELGDQTRFNLDCGPIESEDGWEYQYRVDQRKHGFGYCVAEETVFKNKQAVFSLTIILPDPLAK